MTAVAQAHSTRVESVQGGSHATDPHRDHARLDDFLAPLRILPLDREAAEIGGRLRARLHREGRRIGELDLLIAAQALASRLVLVSNNLREFERVPGLRTENWAEAG